MRSIEHARMFEALKKELRKDPDPRIWEDLVAGGQVTDADLTDDTISLVKEYRRKDKIYNRRQSSKSDTQRKVYRVDADLTLRYISEIVAIDAQQNQDFLSFRDKYLSGKLLTLEEVQPWIEHWQREEPVEPDHYIGQGESAIPVYEPSVITLDYQWGDMLLQESIPVREGGMLHQVKTLAEFNAIRYGWDEPETVTFILTGMSPIIQKAKVHVQFHIAFPRLSSLIMEVNANTSPLEVTRIYSEARKMLIPGNDRRHRSMSEKHLRLALFIHKQKRESGKKKWIVLMKEWNALQNTAGDRYDKVTNFARDAKQAHDRLVEKV